MSKETQISKAVAPEDLRRGDYVSVLNVTLELIPCFSLDKWDREIEPVRTSVMPWQSRVMRVVEISLPFVLAKRPEGKHVTIDVRRYRLARVSEKFGRKTFKRLKPKPEKPQTTGDKPAEAH